MKINLGQPVVTDSLGRQYNKWYDPYGNKQYGENTPYANRRALALERTKPSTKPPGGYRARPPKRKFKKDYYLDYE